MPARIQDYLGSLGSELFAVKDRIRNLKSEKAWLADGEWKESALRSVLRRHLPADAQVGTGYVIGDTWSSTQIDILIHRSSHPTLFRDGDFVLVTPDAVLCLIEVKTSLGPKGLATACRTLAANIEMVRRTAPHQCFAGLYIYERLRMKPERTLRRMADACTSWNHTINFFAAGPSQFVRYWQTEQRAGMHFAHRWEQYDLTGMAAGYFIHNCVEAVTPESVAANRRLWYLEEGKNPYRVAEQQADWF